MRSKLVQWADEDRYQLDLTKVEIEILVHQLLNGWTKTTRDKEFIKEFCDVVGEVKFAHSKQ